ncbi:hypothetical protein J2T57_001481 [Natronocella acetinitrilica]|uniref:DUF3085 domain-containing protein n=1 Tax=Natronocella acetinitrilica TaxID=414046 RepID=A0AAE3G2E9_9GAMM|nr:DUF3085 domain-containing protein [Natronocella acetinitrilica]MCP1674379.1 hypothetical protein [Natronocella acetinitrilica]
MSTMKPLFFRVGVVRALVEHAQSASLHSPTFAQSYEGEYLKPGVDLMQADGTRRFPKADDIDLGRVPAGLHLVGDSGVYLMSNGEPRQLVAPGSKESLCAYAVGIDPEAFDFDGWWERKREVFGGDDGVEFLPLDNLEALLKGASDDDYITIMMNPESFRLHSETLPRGAVVAALAEFYPDLHAQLKPQRFRVLERSDREAGASPDPGLH